MNNNKIQTIISWAQECHLLFKLLDIVHVYKVHNFKFGIVHVETYEQLESLEFCFSQFPLAPETLIARKLK